VKDACNVTGIPRSTYYQVKAGKRSGKSAREIKDGEILEKIQAIKLDHPFWGYRRVRAWLVYRETIPANHKRVHRLMKENGLMVRQKQYKAIRTPQRSKPKAEKPGQFWGIDMTKVMIPAVGWTYLVIVLDWYTKKIVGWDITLRSKTEDWKRALDMAINNEFPGGVRGRGLKLISDNGSQPTSVNFMKEMATLGIEQIFTSYNNPKGNAETERVMRTIKEEIVWINEFSRLEETKEKLSTWINIDYNLKYVHSAIGYMSPIEFEKKYIDNTMKKVA